ncbi:MAG: hypothetical protein RBT61_11025 [Candidatus Kapabacteria bacterium]|jgi:hypothetical protein|nr:hypothetical protein [Candidatus Kapabacteria bacterium]
MKNLFILAVIALFVMTLCTYTQVPCQPNSKSYFVRLDNLRDIPPLSIGMPYETLIGYIAADSVCRYSRADHVNDFINRQTDGDTIRYIMKHFYWMTDYNPLLAEQYSSYYAEGRMRADFILDDLLNYVRRNYPISYQLLLESYYILHIRVNQTFIVDSLPGPLCRNMTVVAASLLDTIKGQIIPVIEEHPNNSVGIEDLKLQSTGANFIFNFCNQWTRAGKDPLDDRMGNAWIKTNTEYIVFLYPRMICQDASHFYLTIFPSGLKSQTHGMFPIIDGNVQDLGNEFGWGTSVPLPVFKQNLQQLIDQIRFYGN